MEKNICSSLIPIIDVHDDFSAKDQLLPLQDGVATTENIIQSSH